MFLNQLSENEKEAFLSLAIHVSYANGIFSDEEKAMVNEYCHEMCIDKFDTEAQRTMEYVVDVFKGSDLHIKRVVLLETIGLVYADGDYDEEEKHFVEEFAENIGLDKIDVDKQSEVIIEYLAVLKKIADIVQ